MPLHIFLSTWLGTSFGALEFAKIAKDILLFAGFLFAFCLSIPRPWFKDVLQDRLVWLISGYSLLTIGLVVIRPTDQDAEVLGAVYNLRFLVFFMYGLLLSHLFDARRLRTAATKAVVAVGTLVVAFGVVQYVALPDDALRHVGYSRENGVLPAFFIDDKPDLERVMSTVRDPNSLGSYLIILGSLVAVLLMTQKDRRRKLFWAGFLGLASFCLLLTFSRSAWAGFAVAAVVFVALGGFYRKILPVARGKLAMAGLTTVLVLALGGLYVFRDGYVVQNVLLHSDKSTVLEDPNELRLKFYSQSVQDIVNNPLGRGPGTAGLASIRNDIQGTNLNENYYLQIAAEVGLAGLLLFLAIILVVGLRLFGLHKTGVMPLALLAALAGLAVTNFLVHIWSNEAVAYTWWGLAGLFMVRGRGSSKKQSAQN